MSISIAKQLLEFGVWRPYGKTIGWALSATRELQDDTPQKFVGRFPTFTVATLVAAISYKVSVVAGNAELLLPFFEIWIDDAIIAQDTLPQAVSPKRIFVYISLGVAT